MEGNESSTIRNYRFSTSLPGWSRPPPPVPLPPSKLITASGSRVDRATVHTSRSTTFDDTDPRKHCVSGWERDIILSRVLITVHMEAEAWFDSAANTLLPNEVKMPIFSSGSQLI